MLTLRTRWTWAPSTLCMDCLDQVPPLSYRRTPHCWKRTIHYWKMCGTLQKTSVQILYCQQRTQSSQRPILDRHDHIPRLEEVQRAIKYTNSEMSLEWITTEIYRLWDRWLFTTSVSSSSVYGSKWKSHRSSEISITITLCKDMDRDFDCGNCRDISCLPITDKILSTWSLASQKYIPRSPVEIPSWPKLWWHALCSPQSARDVQWTKSGCACTLHWLGQGNWYCQNTGLIDGSSDTWLPQKIRDTNQSSSWQHH